MDEELYAIKEKLVDTSDQYFEHGKEYIIFFYPKLDLSQTDLFKVVCDNQIMDENEVPPKAFHPSPV